MAADDTGPNVNIAWRIWVGTIATLVPATISVVLRFIARYVARAGYWWDDWTILVALVVNWGMAATRWSQVLLYDYGRHAQYISEEKVQDFWKSFLAVQLTYFSNAVATKASLLLLYHRIFGVVDKFRYALWISGFMIVGWFIACVIASIAGCQPVSYFWNKDQPGRCMDEVNFFRWNGIANMLMDFLVLCLPLTMTWRVKANFRQKLILSGIFLLGGFVCIVSILRIIQFNGSRINDPTYSTINTATWSSVEQSVGIVCACLPTLRPLFRQLYGTSRNGTSDSAGSRARSATIRLSNMGTARSTDHDGSSTVGFARLSEERTPPSLGQDSSDAIYSGAKGDVQSSVNAGDNNGHHVHHMPSGIRLDREIHQTSSPV